MRRFAAARADKWSRGRDHSIIEGHHLTLDTRADELLAVEVALGVVEQVLDLPVLPRHARRRDARALPQLVMVDLRHGSAEALLQLRLHGLDELALALQRAALGKVQLRREDSD